MRIFSFAVRGLVLCSTILTLAGLLTAIEPFEIKANAADTTTADKKAADKKKTDSKGTDSKSNVKVDQKQVDALIAQLKDWFKKSDLNSDGYLDTSELVRQLGTGAKLTMFKKKDTDGDGKISKEEFDAWAEEYAPESVRKHAEEEAELEAKIKQYEQALAKAGQDAKKKNEDQLRRLRDQQRNRRNNGNVNDRLRRELAQAR